ncbi:transporter substrate-binding domain-containing protein [Inhella proteolytica]|uniref:Transporter substrate-binding domain-containing protein n=1 Tax=Inhella proteolytica TaxID=2795029 RepID=A0A931NEA5_9BURK|nr:transporter substrate-binding domain-containing protein [Inhella proteolytica]MBH9577487.1 transporter substrate-binding domain-containing protein [Inhella proteolytica]
MLLLASSLAQAQTVQIEYRDKPPYSYTERGRPAGFLLLRTIELLEQAKVEAEFLEVPVKRILQDIEGNQAPICSPSWYKLPEREKFARFSLPIHQDKPHVVLAHAQAAKAIQRHAKLSALFADPQLTPGLLDGVSYGAELDQALAQTRKPAVRARLNPGQLARMIAAQRADYMLIDQEDLGWLRNDPEFNSLNLVRFEFPDMPAGLLRYLMCSRQVDPAVLERVNQAIRQRLPELAGRG